MKTTRGIEIKPSIQTLKNMFQMTGLDVENDRIIEFACIVTDQELNVIAEVMYLAISVI